MEHRELYELKGGHCSYKQCACGKGLLKLGSQTFSLYPSVASDLLRMFSIGQEAKLPIKLPGSPLSTPAPGMFQWAQAEDLPVHSRGSRVN